MSELSGADRLLLSAVSPAGAEIIAAALAAHDPAADCPTCGVGDGSHALGCPRIPASTAGQQPTGAALIRGILACGAFVPATQAELLRIAETLEIAEAMESLAPATSPEPAGEMAQQPEHNAWVVAVGLLTFRGMCSCGWTGTEFYSQPFAYRQAAQHVTAATPPPAPEPERAGADAPHWRPAAEYHEDFGPVLWIDAEDTGYLYVGTALDTDFPEELSHWMPVVWPTEAPSREVPRG